MTNRKRGAHCTVHVFAHHEEPHPSYASSASPSTVLVVFCQRHQDVGRPNQWAQLQAEAALPSSGSYACITVTLNAWKQLHSTAREGLALSNNSIYTEGVGSISRLQKRATHLPLTVALHVPFDVPTTSAPASFLVDNHFLLWP